MHIILNHTRSYERTWGRVLLILGMACLFVASTAGTQAQSHAETLYTVMTAGDTEGVLDVLLEIIHATDTRTPSRLSWHVQAFDNPINFYSHSDEAVHLSAIPSPEEAETYWNGWSVALTEGRWSPDAFFSDREEAYLLAAFNQTVLGAHELGHTLAFYYSVNPRTLEGSVYCQELLADRVAAGVVHTLAHESHHFEQLRERYLALIADIQVHITEELRVSTATLSDCETLPVLYPTSPELFVRYASAFFMRQIQLLSLDNAMPLDEVLNTYIKTREIDYHARYPAEDVGCVVRTFGDTNLARTTHIGIYSIFMARFMQSKEPQVAVTLSSTGEPIQLTLFPYPLEDGSPQLLVEDNISQRSYDVPENHPEVMLLLHQVAAGPDNSVVALVMLVPEDMEEPSSIHLLEAPYEGAVRIGPELVFEEMHDKPQIHLMADQNDYLFILATEGIYSIDLTTLTLSGPVGSVPDVPERPVALDAEGRIYFADGRSIGYMVPNMGLMSVGPGGNVILRNDGTETVRIAGSGFPESTDGPAHEADIGLILVARIIGDAIRWVEAGNPPVLREAVRIND